MHNHTKGPWHIQHCSYYTAICSDEKVIANMRYIDNSNEDDAKLISAAPELLEALQDALSELEYLKNAPDSAYARPDDETIKAVRAALTKAGVEA